MNDREMTDETIEVIDGATLLEQWGCQTREQKLERACIALTHALNELHKEAKGQDLSLRNNHFCGCADAYNMGIEALRKTS